MLSRNFLPVICSVLVFICCQTARAQKVLVTYSKQQIPLEAVRVACGFQAVNGPYLLTNENGRVRIDQLADCDSIVFYKGFYETRIYTYAELKAMNFKVSTELNVDAVSGFWVRTMPEVVVAASRWAQVRKDVPNRIAVINPYFNRNQNPQTSADMLANSGEVYVQKSQLGGGSPMMRGFAANRVLLVVDGVRMNNAIFRSGNLQNVISIDPFALSVTEVAFGPGSVQYGSDAIGGVMSFQTIDPLYSGWHDSIETYNSSALRYSSANREKTAHTHFSVANTKWTSFSSITYSDFGNLRMGSHGPEEYLRPAYVTSIDGRDSLVLNPDPKLQRPTAYSQLNLLQKISFRPSDKWEIGLSTYYSASSDIPRYDRLTEFSNGQPRFAEWYYGPQSWLFGSLRFHHNDTTRLYDRARLTISYQQFGESRHDRRFRSSTIRHQRDALHAYIVNLDLKKAIGRQQELNYGAEVVLNLVRSKGSLENLSTAASRPDATRYPDGSHYRSVAGYGSYQYRVSEKVTLQAGARFSHISLRADFDITFFPLPFTSTRLSTNALNGLAGLTYRPAYRWQLNVLASTGFRAPNIDDIGKIFESAPGSLVVPNPGLKPEYAWNAEATALKAFGSKINGDLTGYYTFLNDALVRRNFRLNGHDSVFYHGELSQVQAIQNAAHAYVWGLQAGLSIKLPFHLALTARYNYQRGKEEDEAGAISELRHAAPAFGLVRLTFFHKKVLAELSTIRSEAIPFRRLALSEREKPALYATDSNGNPFAPAWQTYNFKISYNAYQELYLSAGIENITDRRYRTYSSGIAAAGRNYVFSIHYSFLKNWKKPGLG